MYYVGKVTQSGQDSKSFYADSLYDIAVKIGFSTSGTFLVHVTKVGEYGSGSHSEVITDFDGTCIEELQRFSNRLFHGLDESLCRFMLINHAVDYVFSFAPLNPGTTKIKINGELLSYDGLKYFNYGGWQMESLAQLVNVVMLNTEPDKQISIISPDAADEVFIGLPMSQVFRVERYLRLALSYGYATFKYVHGSNIKVVVIEYKNHELHVNNNKVFLLNGAMAFQKFVYKIISGIISGKL